ncbi:hypothetical protein [Rhodococcus koreensis]|uniref:Uncharacterized protein n=1 Tax=Rhodococcus koreensis TaxID=99653 RepID=A0A1H5C1B4_9NOCA|nr:hypothetical protein [Rhodococcus koreensis]SED60318.1 hypothetical protein SAMN04490239_8950 [Rhodococcus koreensis]
MAVAALIVIGALLIWVFGSITEEPDDRETIKSGSADLSAWLTGY